MSFGDENKDIYTAVVYIDSPSVAVGCDISPLKRVKFKMLTTSR
jgi:hypothetical protein